MKTENRQESSSTYATSDLIDFTIQMSVYLTLELAWKQVARYRAIMHLFYTFW
jgi:hypothetical protein